MGKIGEKSGIYSHETEEAEAEAEADDADDDDVNCSWLEPGTSSKRQFSSRSLLLEGEKIATEVVVVWHSLQPRRCSCRGTIAASSSSSNGSSCTCTIIIIYGPQLSWSFVPFLLLPLFSLSLFIIVCWWCACLYFCFFFYACACISLGGSRSSSMVI